MASRVLVCLEDTGVSHVIAARLMRDGADGVVVDAPAKLADEARKGAVALVVQDRYKSGDVGSSLLRQARVARGEVVVAVVVVTGELAGPDRHVLEKQYKARAFLPASSSPLQIVDAVMAAAGLVATGGGTTEGAPATSPSDEELVLHEDEVKNEFDISIESQAAQLDAAFSGAFDDDEGDMTLRTVEISKADLERLKKNGAATGPVTVPTVTPPSLPTRRVHDEVTAAAAATNGDDVVDVGSDLSQLPAPGGDNDFDLQPRPTLAGGDDYLEFPKEFSEPPKTSVPDVAVAPPPLPRSPPRTPTPAPSKPASSPPVAAPLNPSTPPSPAASRPESFATPSDVSMGTHAVTAEGDAMQIQELQRTQAELKKALLAERKAREAAQKRVEELETRLQKMGEAPTSTGQGVPTDGVFEDLRYPALLARCRSEAFTGSIVMQSGGATRSVYVKDGLPVAFSSSEPGQRIGKVLVSQGRITDEQYMKAATRMVEKSIKLTDALVELGLIDGESLAVEQRNLTRDQIIQGFEIVQGRFTTTAQAAPDANTATFDFGPGEIYVQGYRRYAPANEMLAAYETLRDKYLIANARLSGYRPKLGLTPEDERMLRLLGEALTVEEATERAQLSAEHVSRLLSALQALDLVEEWSPGVEQFRSRIRAEKQRTAEELQTLHVEHKRREDRLLEAFERALAGRGDASGLASALSSSSSSSPSLSSPPVELVKEPIVPPAPRREEKKPTITAPKAEPRVEPRVEVKPPEPKAEKPLSSLSQTLANAAMSSPTSSASSTSNAASSASIFGGDIILPALSESSPADKKYREGIEQATQNRLDEAELTLREAVRLDAAKPEYLTSLARVLLANPRYERAGTLPVVRSLLDRAVQIAPDHTEATELHKQVVTEMGG